MLGRTASRNWRHRLRINLRGLIVLVLVIGALLSWLVRSARVQHEAVAAIQKVGGKVGYNWERKKQWIRGGRPWAPRWLVQTLGVDYFGHVAVVIMSLPDPPDEVLIHIGNLDQLEELLLYKSSLNDEMLLHLEGLCNVRNLQLNWSDSVGTARISDAGLEHLMNLTNLEDLNLNYTQITDAGLIRLGRLTKLKSLGLEGTQITDAGLVHLKSLTKLAYLVLSGTAHH